MAQSFSSLAGDNVTAAALELGGAGLGMVKMMGGEALEASAGAVAVEAASL